MLVMNRVDAKFYTKYIIGSVALISKIASSAYYASVPLVIMYVPQLSRDVYWDWIHAIFLGQTQETFKDLLCRTANYCTELGPKL